MLNSGVIWKQICIPLSAIIQYYLSTDAQLRCNLKANMHAPLSYYSILNINRCSSQGSFRSKYAYPSQLLFDVINQRMLTSRVILYHICMPLSTTCWYYLSMDAQLHAHIHWAKEAWTWFVGHLLFNILILLRCREADNGYSISLPLIQSRYYNGYFLHSLALNIITFACSHGTTIATFFTHSHAISLLGTQSWHYNCYFSCSLAFRITT